MTSKSALSPLFVCLSTYPIDSQIITHIQVSLTHKSMRSEHIQEHPPTNQLNAYLVPFSTFANNSKQTTCIAGMSQTEPHTRGLTNNLPLAPPHAGTVVTLTKHCPIKHHVGATHHRYPATDIGDTLLKQQAIITINDIPSIITRLKHDLAEIKRTCAFNISATPKKTKRKDGEKTSETNFFDASDDTAAADADKSSDPETETRATSIYSPIRCETGECTAAF